MPTYWPTFALLALLAAEASAESPFLGSWLATNHGFTSIRIIVTEANGELGGTVGFRTQRSEHGRWKVTGKNSYRLETQVVLERTLSFVAWCEGRDPTLMKMTLLAAPGEAELLDLDHPDRKPVKLRREDGSP